MSSQRSDTPSDVTETWENSPGWRKKASREKKKRSSRSNGFMKWSHPRMTYGTYSNNMDTWLILVNSYPLEPQLGRLWCGGYCAFRIQTQSSGTSVLDHPRTDDNNFHSVLDRVTKTTRTWSCTALRRMGATDRENRWDKLKKESYQSCNKMRDTTTLLLTLELKPVDWLQLY